MTIDEELKELCVLAVKNALYQSLDKLMATAKKALEGIDYYEGILYDVHAFGDTKPLSGADGFNIWSGLYEDGKYMGISNGHDSLIEALENDRMNAVFMCGKMVFAKRDGEWMYVGDK